MSNLDSILSKLQKLKAKAESASEIGNAAEASAFMAKVRELLVRHELSMSDVEYANVRDKDPIRQGDRVGETSTQRRLWQERLGTVIAKAFFCRILANRGTDAIWFVGRDSHRLMAEYLYTRLRHELESNSNREYKRLRSRLRRKGQPLDESHEFKESFRREYIDTIHARLRAMQEEEKLEAAKTGVSIIRLTNALTQVNEFVDDKYKSKNKGLRSRSASNEAGRNLGRKYGERANLSVNGVNEGSSPKQIK